MKLVGVFFLLCLDAISMEGGIFIRGNGGISMSGGNPGCAPVIHSSNGPVDIQTNSVDIDHGTIAGEGVHVAAKNVSNRAGKIYSSTSICIDADNQRNETVINKWSQDIRHGRNYAHAEGISSIDECELRAPIVIQKGKHIENIGIKVSADVYEDHGKWTSNMPARATLHNYSHVEKRGFFSRASADCRRLDDVLVPTRFDVGQFRSLQAEGESAAVQFGYTMIKADAGIEVTKDRKEDVLVQERHFMEMHQKKSGLSLFGGVNVPDPTAQLQAMHQAHKNDNMAGLTASSISAAAQAINIGKTIGAMTQPMSTFSMLQLLSRFVNGPSLQFGTREVSTRQFTTIAHGNYFEAPRMKFCNAEKSTFIGRYHGRDIDIQTRTLITFAMPHEMETSTTVRQTGVNLDLLSFAMALLNPEISGITNALLVSSGASISSQTVRSRSVYNVPTSIIADRRLNISAENGLLEHAKIKAGIVHAVFSKDMVLKSLANERWTQKSGGSVSFSPGALIGFDELAQTLVETASSVSLSLIDSVSFERIIDDFAELVGEEEFYLRVGNILRTESAFLGHVRHDPMQEHIEAAEIQHTEVPQFKTGHDRSFAISIPDIAKLVDAVKTHVIADAMEQGASQETAEQMAEAEIEIVKQEIVEVQEAAKKVKKLVREAKSEAAVAKGGKEQIHETECEDALLDSLLHRPVCEPSEIEQQLTHCLREVIYERAQMSDQTLAFVPQNKSEAALQEARLLLSKVRDFIAKYPQAAEILRPVTSFAERVFDELTIPGGVDNLRKYREGLLTSQEYDLIVSRDAMIDTAAMGVGALIGRAGGAYGGAIAGGPVVAVAGANLGALEGAVIGGAASKAVRAVARATVHCMAGGGEDGAQRTNDSKERKQATPQDADRYLDGLRDKRVLSRKGVTKDGHDYYKFESKCEYMGIKFRKGDYISRDELHHEWEWFRGKYDHRGAIDPLSGILNQAKQRAARTLKL